MDASSLESMLRAIVADGVAPLIDRINQLERSFLTRVDEVKTDVALSFDMVEKGEGQLKDALAHVRDEISAIAHLHHGRTAANTGFELEAVLKLTENAAGRIMDAADRISQLASEDKDLASLNEKLSHEINEIFEACSFQDLTGQRIRKAVEHLARIEHTLDSALSRLGDPDSDVQIVAEVTAVPMDQGAIDDLFG